MSARQPTLTLSQYLDLIADLPLPDPQQKEYFIEYVAHSHSWYKHLPPFPPGLPFYFYIDKYAAFDLVNMNDGTDRLVERTKQGFHYADLPADEYRSYFGHLAYSSTSGTAVSLVTAEGRTIPRDKIVAIPDDNGKMVGLPSEILLAGEVRLTSVIHVYTASKFFAVRGFGDHLPTDIEWPEESGGRSLFRKLLKRRKQLFEDARFDDMVEIEGAEYPFSPSSARHRVDPIMYELLEPERHRLRGEMMKAIDRICDLVARERSG